MPVAYYDFFRKILLQPDGVTLEADSIEDTLTITRGTGVAFNPNTTNDSFEINVDYQLYVPIGTTEIRLNDVNSNHTGVKITAGSNISIGRNNNSEITITSTVGGTSKAISNLTQTSPVVVTTTNAHSFTEGIAVTITDVTGMTQVNGNEYYMNVLTSTTFALYEDSNLTIPVNGTGFTAYISGGVATAEYGAPQALSQLADVDLVGTPPVNGTYLQYNGSFWQAGTTLAGNFTGSVFADDSTLLVDGVNGVIPWSVIGGAPTSLSAFTNDSGYLTTVAFNDLTTTPTTLAGYGITDAATSAQGTLADTALQSYTETDPVFSASDAATITSTNITNWDTAYGWGDHSTVGYLTSVTTPTLSSVLAQGNTSALGIDVGASTISGLTITGTVLDTSDSSPLTITPSVTFDTEITVSDIVPNVDSAIDIGSSTNQFRAIYADNFNTGSGGYVNVSNLRIGPDQSFGSVIYPLNTSTWSWNATMDPGYIFHTRTDTYVRWKSTSQLVFNHTNPTGTVDVNFLSSDTHYFYSPTGALTVNFTSIPTTGSRMTNMRIYIYQPPSVSYVPTSFQVNGVAVSNVSWQNGIVPTGTPANIDFIQCLIWSFGGGTYTILAQSNSYS